MRRQRKKKQRKKYSEVPVKCPYCGEEGQHFIPSPFAEKGFFMCTSKKEKGEEGECLDD